MERSPFDTAGVTGILFALLCIGLYVTLINKAAGELETDLQTERGRRRELERDLRKSEHSLDGALGKIHELRRDDEPATDVDE